MNLTQLLSHASPDVRALNPITVTTPPTTEETYSEHDLQRDLFAWIDSMIPVCPALANAFAVPNGGHRHTAVAAKLKAEGVRAGVPDVILLHPSADGCYHGMAIELKVGRNRVTPSQIKWLARLQSVGYYTAVIHDDWQLAAREIAVYLGGI